MYTTLSEIKSRNKKAGRFFFSKDTTQFFKSRYYSEIYQGKYFITSEQPFFCSSREYTIREALPNGYIETISRHSTLAEAKEVVETSIRMV